MDEVIVQNIGSQIAYGMAVYDSTGGQIGTVQQYDLTNGWFQTEKGLFFVQDRYIPFSAISRIGPTGIYLSVSKEHVKDVYNRPPMVDVNVVSGPAGAKAEATVPSGYSGSRVVVDASTISLAISRLDNGLKVYDINGEKVGRVYDYVPGSDWIVVEKGIFSSQDLYVPVTAIGYIDGDGIYLRVSKDVLKTAFMVKPATVNVNVAASPAGAVAVSTAPDGQTGERLIVDSTTLSLAMERLGKGPKVYDLDGKEIGRVSRFDPVSGWMVVEKGVWFPKDLFIPVTAVEYLDNAGVHLRVTKEVLTHAFVVQPASVSFVVTPVPPVAITVTPTTDATITADVLAELTWDPAVTVANLDISSMNGLVTLSGTVPTFSMKMAAGDAASRVHGVIGLTNNIVVDPIAFGDRTDGAIEADVRAALALDTTVPLDRVSVAVSHGIVTLAGNLDYYYQRAAAEEDAGRVAGVVGIDDLITVTPPGAMSAEVADHIARAFARNAELADDKVSVTVDGSKVTLDGTVRTWSEYSDAADAAWRAPGVSFVVNNIHVTY
jgi:osmotically-inducible protein OsmY